MSAGGRGREHGVARILAHLPEITSHHLLSGGLQVLQPPRVTDIHPPAASLGPNAAMCHLARLDLAFGPLDQEPLFGVSLGPIVVPGCRPQAHGGEAGIEFGVGSFTPGDRAPSLGVELFGQGLGRDRLVIVGSADPRRAADLFRSKAWAAADSRLGARR